MQIPSLRWGVPVVCIVIAACAPPPARLFPIAPIAELRGAEGNLRRMYDSDGDGASDCGEVLGADGRIAVLLADVPVAFAPAADARQLLIILDSVPYEMVRDAWKAGRFRAFYPPSRVISVFPAMTDPAIAEFFGVSPCPGVESVYYDGKRLMSGYSAYLDGRNAPWTRLIDWRLELDDHTWAYLWPGDWFAGELGEIQRALRTHSSKDFAAYCVGTSALGSKRGRDGHQEALVQVDRLCQQLLHESRGALRITLMSDHGHFLDRNRRISLSAALERCGYRLATSLRESADVIVPEFGLVSCAAIYTRSPAAVARDTVVLDGVELTCYVESPAESGRQATIVVLSRDGEARVTSNGRGFRYNAIRGDPLLLRSTWERAHSAGDVDENGFILDRSLFTYTANHELPDAVHRVWRAFHGLFEHPPDVYVSLEDGYYAGSADLAKWLKMAGVHGNLRSAGSSGFVMTTDRQLPATIRMADVRDALEVVD